MRTPKKGAKGKKQVKNPAKKEKSKARSPKAKPAKGPVSKPKALQRKKVQKNLAKLKKEDRAMWDRQDLKKDDSEFMKMAKQLKNFMVKKKKL